MSRLRELLKQYDFSGIDPETGKRWMPSKIVNLLGLRVWKDPEELRPIVQKVIAANPDIVEQYKKGKKKVVGRLLKEIFDETLEGADPAVTNKVLQEEMEKQ
jgi:aspartyl-tRNA(Asn)/glutamyl-tRNA(Gln) amidotransferase subunit B